MKLHIVLGNQLFPLKYLEDFKIQDLNNFTYKPIIEAENIAKIIKNKYLI